MKFFDMRRVRALSLAILVCSGAVAVSSAQTATASAPDEASAQVAAATTTCASTAVAVIATSSDVALMSDATSMPDAPIPQQAAAPPAQPDANQSQAPAQVPAQAPAQTPAQTTPPPQSETNAQQLSKKEQAARDVQQQEKQRIMGIMPAFNSTSNQNAVPMTPGQKIKLSFRSAIDPWQFGITFIAAGIGQAENSHPGYGQGWEGYAKRYGASYTDLFTGTVIGNGMLPALLHQDPRYFRMGSTTNGVHNSGMKRFLYAISTNVRCKGDNGKWQPNYSNVGGNLIAGGISQAYYPASERGFSLVITNALVVTAEGAIGSELLEFWPDIQRKMFKHKYTDSYTKSAEDAQQQTTTRAQPKAPQPAPGATSPVTPPAVAPAPAEPAPTPAPQQMTPPQE